MVCATNNYACPYVYALFLYLPYVLLKATILHLCALTSSSRSFYYVLGLIMLHHVIFHVTVVSHASSSSKIKRKRKRNIKENC